jgi:hypothetical protein
MRKIEEEKQNAKEMERKEEKKYMEKDASEHARNG